MAEHSPGPFACDESAGWVFDARDNCVATCETPDLPEHEWRANCRLLAAAPGLLAAAVALLEANERAADAGHCWEGARDALLALYDAAAAAEGEGVARGV